MIHSCLGMLSQLHRMKRDKQYTKYCESNTMAHVYATLALQLELCLPSWISSFVSSYVWNKVNTHLTPSSEIKHWTHSSCHRQIVRMLKVRNEFVPENDEHCRNVFYSFVLPYITSPLDLVLYWQQLSILDKQWKSYLQSNKPVFSEKQLEQVLSVSMTTTAPGHMLQWWVLVGLSLTSDRQDALAEYTQQNVPSVSQNHPSSNLLRHHQSMIYHLLEATRSDSAEKASQSLQRAFIDRKASQECIDQISSVSYISDNDNLEASVLTLSSLAIHVHTYKAVKSIATQSHLTELRNQILEDLESPYTKSLSAKFRKTLTDDTLCI